MRNIAAWLKEHDDFAIVPHVSPDGDSYGSCLAMAMALQGMGKRAFVAAPPVPLMYDFLPGQDLLHTAGDMPFAPKARPAALASAATGICLRLPMRARYF